MRLDNFLFGYVNIYFDESDEKKVLNRLLGENLTGKIYEGGYIEVPLIRSKKYMRSLAGVKIKKSGILGLPGMLLGVKKRYGIIFGLILCALYFALSSSLVWDVRIEGCSGALTGEICEELSQAGLEVGAPWHSLSFDKVENAVLMRSDKIAWLNINRRGTVAYVTVGEKKIHDSSESEGGYSNIVATEDAVIEEISVKKGIAMVKPGDTVKSGQLLVSGVIPSELGGGFVNAEAEIHGRIYREIEVYVPKSESVTTRKTGELAQLTVKIFNFSINIYKNYRNIGDDCAIIESEECAVIFGSLKLPLGLKKAYVERSESTEVVRDDKELISVASHRLAALRILKMGNAELIRISSSSGFTDDGFKMRSGMVLLTEIGEKKFFSSEEKTEE